MEKLDRWLTQSMVNKKIKTLAEFFVELKIISIENDNDRFCFD